MVHGIREHFGLPGGEDSDARTQRWLEVEREHTRGMHVYSAEQWGLDPAAIQGQFAEYIERFEVPVKR